MANIVRRSVLTYHIFIYDEIYYSIVDDYNILAPYLYCLVYKEDL